VRAMWQISGEISCGLDSDRKYDKNPGAEGND
jgi:hypothetical protein